MRQLNLISIGLAAFATALLGSCSSTPDRVSAPPFYERLDQTQRPVDPASSTGMINQYRGNNGLRPLVWNDTLARVAKAAAERMASADRVLGATEVNLSGELATSGYRSKSYVANLSAGYRTFAEAFSGWRELKDNNAHMLDPRGVQIGLATAYVPGSKYRVFWALVIAEPQ
ncbi:MAG: CAP domain-containing protein [Ancalomicrobiaceae bacterium]|nr:CAP domain-containing protein [Ancalomicrobiaceae bacterium]